MPISCPSAEPGTPGARIFGVVLGSPEEPRVSYLAEPLPRDVTPELDAGLRPTEVFRFVAPCANSGCGHFRGGQCSLAQRIRSALPAVVSSLPPCPIRASCRWWRQEGPAACLRCPAIVSDGPASKERERIAGWPGTAEGDQPAR